MSFCKSRSSFKISICLRSCKKRKKSSFRLKGRWKAAYSYHLPSRASSAYVQKHGGIPPRHPKDDCERDSAGSQRRGPEWSHALSLFVCQVLSRGGQNLNECLKAEEVLTDLYVLSERVEDLFGYFHCFGEVLLPVGIDYILPWVVPVEVTDWLLKCSADIMYSWWACSGNNAMKKSWWGQI